MGSHRKNICQPEVEAFKTIHAMRLLSATENRRSPFKLNVPGSTGGSTGRRKMNELDSWITDYAPQVGGCILLRKIKLKH